MKKFVVDYLYDNYFSARSKAREDVNIIAEKLGYQPIILKTRTTTENFSLRKTFYIGKFCYNLKKLVVLFNTILSIPSKSKILIQFPISPLGDFFSFVFCYLLNFKGCNITILVHDIVSYREKGYFKFFERKTLNCVTRLILHTPNMKMLFEEIGINKPKIDLLYLFDYITSQNPLIKMKEDDCIKIAFAGALYKSEFLRKLDTIRTHNLVFLLYGVNNNNLKLSQNIVYQGKFKPEDIKFLNADWGLVWDGNSLNKCDGILGTYLKVNSPHKTSLYLAASLPIIIWKESALASFIKKNKLGIVVDSIDEIGDAILALSDEEMDAILSSVSIFSAKLRSGQMLSSLL